MSLWLRRKDKQGRVHYYSVYIPWLALLAMLGIAIALLLPLLQSCRH